MVLKERLSLAAEKEVRKSPATDTGRHIHKLDLLAAALSRNSHPY